jgi:hypothetical protein
MHVRDHARSRSCILCHIQGANKVERGQEIKLLSIASQWLVSRVTFPFDACKCVRDS